MIASTGIGSLTQSAGTVSLATTGFYIGQNAGSNGTYNLNGGQLNMGWEYVGYSGTGTVTQTGGTLTQNGSYFALGENAGGVGTYSLSGSGLVSVENIIIGAAERRGRSRSPPALATP